MWNKLDIKTKRELMKTYRKGGFSYGDMVSDYNKSYQERQDVSKMGYRDDSPYKNRESIEIDTPTGVIDMSETGTPLMANGRYLPPYSGKHQFNTTKVVETPAYQNGGEFTDYIKAKLNPYNWGVKDYTESGEFPNAYSEAKRQGEKEFMWNNKRYNTAYAGTPRQEIGAYGVDGKRVDQEVLKKSDDGSSLAKVNIYDPLSIYLPGHIEASMHNNSISVNYGEKGNRHLGIDTGSSSSGGASGKNNYNVYGVDSEKFFNKVLDLEIKDEKNEKGYNLLTNNCADCIDDAFGLPRRKGIETPQNTLSRIREKYPTIKTTGRTYSDYVDLAEKANKESSSEVLSKANYLLGIAYSPDMKNSLASKGIIEAIQKALTSEGYQLPRSTKKDGKFDGVFGQETKAALESYQKGQRPKYQNGGEIPKYDSMQLNQPYIPYNPSETVNQPVITDIRPYLNKRTWTQEELDQKEYEERMARIADSKAAYEEQKRQGNLIPTTEQLARQTQAIGDKLRVSTKPNIFDDYINPLPYIGNMASGVGRAPLDVKQGNYGQAALSVVTPLVAGAVGGIGAKGTGQFINNMINPAAGIIPTRSSYPHLYNPGSLTRNINSPSKANINSYVGGTTDVPSFNRQLKDFTQSAQHGKQPMLGSLNFNTPKGEMWSHIVEDAKRRSKNEDEYFKILLENSKKAGFSIEDQISMSESFLSRYNRDKAKGLGTDKYNFIFDPDFPQSGQMTAVDKINPIITNKSIQPKNIAELDQEIINKLKKIDPEGYKNFSTTLQKENIKEFKKITKDNKEYKGVDAFKNISVNKYGGIFKSLTRGQKINKKP